MKNTGRYRKAYKMNFPNRTWPDNEINKAPVWCSVDLRDGNQALIEPMIVEEKIEMFNLLVKLGFKEIEIGFPAASQIEFDFLRQLVDRKLIPDDVCIQVLTQCREHLIRRTFEAIRGIKKTIFHIYNSTSKLQRDVVFNMGKEEVKDIALNAVRCIKEYMNEHDGEIILEYSPESFTATEIDYALEVCNSVIGEWGVSDTKKMIINIPSTVEMHTPNVFADQIEYMNNNLNCRENIILSVHTHNDRGTGIAASELALLAGAQRVEGTLFGNGERTGNVDILSLGYNMFSQGIDPNLNLENIKEISEVYERCTKMVIPPRHPYAGQLVFTAFSGSHQDAINKGVHAMQTYNKDYWEVPYLPIDPSDIGRVYEPVIRINSQSGKGGVAFVLESYYGYKLPKGMHKEFADIIQELSEKVGEVSPEQVFNIFKESYINVSNPFKFNKYVLRDSEKNEVDYDTLISIQYEKEGKQYEIEGIGNGPLDATQNALENALGMHIRIVDYNEHALGSGSRAKAASYINILDLNTGHTSYGVGISTSITKSSIRGIFSAFNRLINMQEE